MANINVRSSDETVKILKDLSEKTRSSQYQVIDNALRLYKDYIKIQESKRESILKKM